MVLLAATLHGRKSCRSRPRQGAGTFASTNCLGVHEARQLLQEGFSRFVGYAPRRSTGLGVSKPLSSCVSRILNPEFTRTKRRLGIITLPFETCARSRANAGLRRPPGVARAGSTAGYVADRRSDNRTLRADALLTLDAVGMRSNRGRPAGLPARREEKWTTPLSEAPIGGCAVV